jgi:predicted metal-dependent phosphoesterase TrpH
MRCDLHTHTNASDGSLTPAELLSYAAGKKLACLSITDHDSVAAYDELDCSKIGDLRIIPGIEFSTTWQGQNIHVLGLNINPQDGDLRYGVQQQKKARNDRAEKIAERLRETGIRDLLDKVSQAANGASIGRPHFAQLLVAEGVVANLKQAYRRFLGNGKAGDVRQYWADMATVVSWIRAAGGTAVLAHPGHYRLTHVRTRRLACDFVASGGQAIEVCNGVQSPGLTSKLAMLCEDLELLASCGSDFHANPSNWSDVGRFSALPGTCRPVWDSW